jgi:hypothetical protein
MTNEQQHHSEEDNGGNGNGICLEKRLLAEADWLQKARAGPAFEQVKSFHLNEFLL